MSTSTEVIQVTTALAEFDKVAAGLADLEKAYKGVVYEVRTREGMKAACDARREIKAPRVALEKRRAEAKKPLLDLGRKLDSEAKRITEALAALEDPIDLQIKTEEDRLHNEAVARAAAETKRVEELEARLDSIRTMPYEANGLGSKDCQAILDEARAMVISEDWQEFAEKAKVAKVATVAALEGVLAKAVAAEVEAARIIAERAELEKLRAEQAAREKAAEIALRVELSKQQAESERIAAEQKAESQRLAAQAAEIEAARKKLADEQEAARLAALPLSEPEPEIILIRDSPAAVIDTVNVGTLPAADRHQIFDNAFTSHFAKESPAQAQERREASIPSDAAIIQCVADHFRVSLIVAIEYIVSVAMNHEEAA